MLSLNIPGNVKDPQACRNYKQTHWGKDFVLSSSRKRSEKSPELGREEVEPVLTLSMVTPGTAALGSLPAIVTDASDTW